MSLTVNIGQTGTVFGSSRSDGLSYFPRPSVLKPLDSAPVSFPTTLCSTGLWAQHAVSHQEEGPCVLPGLFRALQGTRNSKALVAKMLLTYSL